MPDDDKPEPFKPIGEDLTPAQRAAARIPEDRQQTHALQHIARVLDRIDAKLDRLLEARETPKPQA